MVGSKRPNRCVVEPVSTAGFEKRALVVSEQRDPVQDEAYRLRPVGILTSRPRASRVCDERFGKNRGTALAPRSRLAKPPVSLDNADAVIDGCPVLGFQRAGFLKSLAFSSRVLLFSRFPSSQPRTSLP